MKPPIEQWIRKQPGRTIALQWLNNQWHVKLKENGTVVATADSKDLDEAFANALNRLMAAQWGVL